MHGHYIELIVIEKLYQIALYLTICFKLVRKYVLPNNVRLVLYFQNTQDDSENCKFCNCCHNWDIYKDLPQQE